MKLRFVGIIGLLLVLAALILGSFGPSLWPSAFWSSSYREQLGPSTPGSGMMGMMNGSTANGGMMGMMNGDSTNGGMMNGGMMGGGMMNGGMIGGGMMNGGVISDSNAPFDQRFLDQMIAYHQGAVNSAQMMIADSARPELRDLAQRIITTRQREIDQMRQWRQGWYGAANNVTRPGMMGGAMMSRDQMRQMMGASVDFDRMFLQMMIAHQEAAIAIAQQSLAQAEHTEIKTLAQSIVTTQQAEIAEMQGYLRDWYGVQKQ